MNKLGYHEPHESLNNRISAHAKYSDFNLHKWIESHFHIKEGDSVFDVGCGNGNYVELFLSKIKEYGVFCGIDKNEALINEANSKYAEIYNNVSFNVGDYDSIDGINNSFEWIFSVYSLYYTSDSKALIKKLRKYLSLGGRLIVIGPASNNAIDLDDLNFKVTGVLPNIEHKLRAERIESEFLPLFESMFGKDNTKLEIVDSVMTFPSIDEFAAYYWSTLLWRDSVASSDFDSVHKLQNKTLQILSTYHDYTIKKQMSCLVGVNS
jgi:ubiquinone/menaquinone biosynthesis C-methylase UbiE